jgi:hypothetical protein
MISGDVSSTAETEEQILKICKVGKQGTKNINIHPLAERERSFDIPQY